MKAGLNKWVFDPFTHLKDFSRSIMELICTCMVFNLILLLRQISQTVLVLILYRVLWYNNWWLVNGMDVGHVLERTVQQMEGWWIDHQPFQLGYWSILGQRTEPPNCPQSICWRVSLCIAFMYRQKCHMNVCVTGWMNKKCYKCSIEYNCTI